MRVALIALFLSGTLGAFVINSETAADTHTSALVLIVSRGLTTFKEGSPVVSLEPTLVLEGPGVASASIAIATEDLTDGDQLGFVNNGSTMSDIAGSFNAGTLSLTGTATVLQWRNALRAVTFYTNSKSPTSRSNTRTIEWSIVDSTAKTKTGETTFIVDPMNGVPIIGGFNPVAVAISTTTLLATSATVADADSANFNGGNINVTGAVIGDVLSISPDTPAADGAIRSNGGNVERHNGSSWVLIGTHSGGEASTFTVQFSSNTVTDSIAEAVLRAIRVTIDATDRSRIFVVTVNDGDGATSSTASVNFASSSDLAVSISLQESTDTGISQTDLVTQDSFLEYKIARSKPTALVGTNFSNTGTAESCMLFYDPESPTTLLAVCGPGTVIINYGITNSAEVTIDESRPTVTLSTTTASTTSGTVIDFVLAGNEPLNCGSVDKTKFVLTGLSGLTTPKPLSDGTCGFSGISSVVPGASGSSGITGVSGISIADLAGNTTSSVTGAPTVTVNRAFPAVTSISIKASSDTGMSNSDGLSKASTLEYDVSFSESVAGVSASDFDNEGTSTGCEFTPSANSGNSIVVAVSGCTEGTVELVLSASTVTGMHGDGPATDKNAESVLIDRTAPGVVGFVPTHSATSVAVDESLSMTFDEPVLAATGNVVVRTNSGVVATVSISSAQVTGSGTRTVFVGLVDDFAEGTDYYVTIEETALVDKAGNAYVGINSSSTWRFRTVEPMVLIATTTVPTENDATTTSTTTITTTTSTTTTTTSFSDVVIPITTSTVTSAELAVDSANEYSRDNDAVSSEILMSPEKVAESVVPTTLVDDVRTTESDEVFVTETMSQESNEGTSVVLIVLALLGATAVIGTALQLLRQNSR